MSTSLLRLIGVASCALIALTACGGIGGGRAPQLYVLKAPGEISTDAEATHRQVAIAMPSAPAYLDTTRIALTQSATTTDYFANSEWTDRVPVLVQDLLVKAFEKSGKLKAVFRDSGMFKADYGIQAEIRSFEAEYATPNTAPNVTVSIDFKLIKQPERDIMASTNIEKSVQAKANNMDSIVDGFNEATAAVLRQTVEWTLGQMTAKPEKRVRKSRHKKAPIAADGSSKP